MSKDIVARALAHRVVLICGDEEVLRVDAWRSILAELRDDDGFDRESFTADKSKPGDWLGSASQIPFLAARRTVLVRHLLRKSPQDTSRTRYDDKHPAVMALAGVPESGFVLLMADDEGGDREKRDQAAKHAEQWTKVVTAAKGLVLEFKSNPSETVRSVMQAADAADKTIKRDAAMLLAEMVGGKLARALAELEKCILYVGDDPVISSDIVKRVVIAESDYKAHQLVQAITTGHTSDAMLHLRQLIAEEGRNATGIVSYLVMIFKSAWQARLGLEMNQRNGGRFSAEFVDLLPDPGLHKEPDWKQRSAFQVARDWNREGLSEAMRVLLDADCRLKGLRPGQSVPDTLETMVLQLSRLAKGLHSGVPRLGDAREPLLKL